MSITGEYETEINLEHGESLGFYELFSSYGEAASGWSVSALPMESVFVSPTAANLVIGAPYYDMGGKFDVGGAYVLPFGSKKFDALDLAGGTKDYKIDLDHVSIPLKFVGKTEDSYLGLNAAPFSIDFNHDGIKDIYVSVYGSDYSATTSSIGAFYDGKMLWGGGSSSGRAEATAPAIPDGAKLIGPIGIGSSTSYIAGDVLTAGEDALITGTTNIGVNVVDLSGHNFKGSTPLSLDDAAFHLALTYGVSVAAGDVNGDGRDDIIASSTFGATGNKVYVVTDTVALDAADGTADGEAVVASIDGANGTTLTGFGGFNINGMPVATGDVDGDGKADVIVSSLDENSSHGIVRVFLGSSFTGQATIDSASLDGTNGFSISGLTSTSRLGKSLAVGDVNNDGFADLLLGAPASNSSRGELFVVFGKASGFDASIDLSTLDGNNGFHITGKDVVGGQFGWAAVVADFTGDGLNDIAVSADQTSTGASLGGSTYIIKGVDPNGPVNRTGTAIANIISGGSSGDTVSGLDGNDWLGGRGGKDKVLGGAGKDTVLGGKGNDVITGGAGRDQLAGGDGGKGEKTDGKDKFVFTDILDSGKKEAKADIVLDFVAGKDKIDVHLIDAKPGGADNHFAFIGGAAFTKAGQIRIVAHGNDTEILFNTVGKSGTDMMIVLDNIKPSALHEGDFIL